MVARGIRNNNPLNIRKGNDWRGERPEQTDPAFEEFETLTFGLRAALILIRNHMNGRAGDRRPKQTISSIVAVWAPPFENATDKYIHFVADHVGIDPRQVIYFTDRNVIVKMVHAMAFVECGVWIDKQLIQSAYDMLV